MCFGLRAETGAGKNYETESYVLDVGSLLQVIPHNSLAVDLENRLEKRLSERRRSKSEVFRWRGLLQNWDDGRDKRNRFPHEIPCFQGGRADAYRGKGGNMYKAICPVCPVEIVCQERCYLSQIPKARDARAVVMALPDVFTNPHYRNFTGHFLNFDGEDRLCVVDEVDVFSLFIDCSVSVKRLERLCRDWEGYLVSEFADCLLRFLQTGDFQKMGRFVAMLSETERNEISEELRSVRIVFGDGHDEIMSLDDVVRDGYKDFATETDIARLPHVDSDWGLLEQLTAFFEHYAREADAPMSYNEKDGVLRWCVPPKLHPDVEKIGFMSGTLDFDLFKRIFPDSELFDVPAANWVDGAEFYQLRTARCPRATVCELDDNYEFKDLKPAGLALWQLMLAEIERTPELKHACISYKSVLEWGKFELSELQVVTANYGGLVGLDTDFRDVDVLWVLFSPEVKPLDIEWRAKMLVWGTILSL